MKEYIMKVNDNGIVSAVVCEIIRCKDCIHYEHCEINDLMLNHENGFCADGEKA